MRKLNLQKIRDELDARGWNQSELARRTGLSAPGILKTLRGDNQPLLSTALAIADALELHIEELLEPQQPEEEPHHAAAC